MSDRNFRWLECVNGPKCVAIEFYWQHHRLAGVPDHRQTVTNATRCEDLCEQTLQSLIRNYRLRAPARQVAVSAIDIAKWSGLNNQQFYDGHQMPRSAAVAVTAHQFRQKLPQGGEKLRQLPHGRPERRFQPPLNHRLTQTSWMFEPRSAPVRPEPATANIASRTAASRSDTVCPATVRRAAIRSAASLEIVAPSNTASELP
jgi:hypothetical protein